MAYDYEKAKQATQMLIEAIGDTTDRPDTKDTPDRCARMYKDILAGLDEDPKKFLKLFPCDADDMVIMRNVPIYSYCAHHMQPFFGKITIAYIPNGQVLGLSKLIRIARVFAKRLQLQENLTKQITDFIEQNIPNKGVAVSIRAHHMCVEIRGARSPGAETVTTRLTGLFKTEVMAREEFLRNCSDKEGYV